jgi:hypothetical protein
MRSASLAASTPSVHRKESSYQSYDLTELGEHYVEYIRMMEHWDAVSPGAVLKVQYEEVVADFENQVRRILDYCDLPFEEACREFHKSARPVNTASAEQVRQPIYQSADEFWRHSEPHLDELSEVPLSPESGSVQAFDFFLRHIVEDKRYAFFLALVHH